MKLLMFVAVFLLGIIAYRLSVPVAGVTSPDRDAADSLPAPRAPARTVSPIEERRQRIEAAMKESPPVRFDGELVQRISDTHWLVRGTFRHGDVRSFVLQDFALCDLPSSGTLVDGKGVRCYAYPVGSYEYVTVAGSTRTIYELQYVSTDAPKPAARPGAWMFDRNRRTGLD